MNHALELLFIGVIAFIAGNVLTRKPYQTSQELFEELVRRRKQEKIEKAAQAAAHGEIAREVKAATDKAN